MPKKQPAPYPVDAEAAANAQTSRAPRNLEETRGRAAQEAAAAGNDEDERGHCPKCHPLPPLRDPKRTHKCARCRSEQLESFAEKRLAQREKAREAAARKAELLK